jgi:hypothetical protein
MSGISDPKWVVRLHPVAGGSVERLLRLPYALDIWQREHGAVVASVPESTLGELERRKLARVERIRPTADYEKDDPSNQ